MSRETPHAPIRQCDIDALVEACLCDGYAFGQITKAIRDEWTDVGLKQAIALASWSIQSIAQKTGALAATAKRVWMEWRNAHPNLTL